MQNDSRSASFSTNRASLLWRLLLELAVIFLGVYGAFVLSEYDGRKEESARRSQLQSALVREIEDITSNTRRVAEFLPKQLAQFDSAVAAGGQPPLEPWIEPVRLQTHMWDATLQSGALDLFDVATVYDISQFYNELNAGFEQLNQLRQLSEAVLIPNLSEPVTEFYEPETHQLRRKYRWHRDGLGRLSRLAASITAHGDSVVKILGAGNGR
jgi:hypothetical protein